MAYIKTDWKNLPNQTTPITKDNLNKMEQGIYDATYVTGVNISNEVDEDYRVNLIGSRNLFDLSYRFYTAITQKATTVSITNGVLTQSVSSGACHTAFQIPVEAGKKYTIKWTGATGFNSVQCSSPDDTQYFRSYQTSDTQTITATGNAINIFLLSSGSELTITNFQIEEGETATTYTPFMQNSMQVDGTKFTDTINVGSLVNNRNRVNLLETKNLFTITSVLPNTALNNNVVFSSSEWDIFVIPVEIGTTYTLSKTSYNGGILSFNTTFPKIDDTVNNAQTLRNISTLTFEAKDNYLCLMIAKSDDKTTIQVEKGSTATTYETFIQNQIVVDNEKYSDTLNVGASLDSRSRVNVLKSYNLFGNYTIINGWIDGTTMRVNSINGNRMAFIPCKANTTYTVTRSVITSSFRVGDYTTIPPVTSSNVDYTIPTATKNDNGTSITYTTSSTAKYIIIHYANTGSDSASTIESSLATIQLVEGSTALPYEPYITPSIVVDNEEIYTKPNIVQLLGDTTPTANTSYTLNDNIFNYKYILLVMSSSALFANSRREYIPIEQVQVSYDYRVGMSTFQSTSVYMFLDLYFEANNSIKCNGVAKGTTGWAPHLKVYGIK